eukprot:UN00143
MKTISPPDSTGEPLLQAQFHFRHFHQVFSSTEANLLIFFERIANISLTASEFQSDICFQLLRVYILDSNASPNSCLMTTLGVNND